MRHLRKRTAEHIRVKWETTKTGWSSGCVSTVDSSGRTIWIADALRGDGKRFVVRADEKLTAFLELGSAVRSVRTHSGLRIILEQFGVVLYSLRDELVGSYGRISTLIRPAIALGQTCFHPSPGMKS